jgi:signal transduction histidine kinase
VRLRQQDGFVHLTIKDDGIGFDPDAPPAKRKGKGGLDLFSMQERAAYMGGALKVKSARGAGTEIEASIPLSSINAAAD